MTEYIFNCTPLTDVIISSSSATEGFHPSLDYIPGAKFWGIVAKECYPKETVKQNLMDIFYNGKIRFGDAHLLINGKRSHKIPLCWFKDKHNEAAGIYVHHKIADYKALTASGVQPKQMPNAYFTEDGKYVEPVQNFSIKSAYDSNLRRSEDEKMFGYYGLPAGSEWQFMVSSESSELLEEVRKTLEGKKRIGRSRSAQYGLVEIKFKEENKKDDKQIQSGTHYLYADSEIMLPVDEPLAEALPGIDFAKSKIRTRIYQNWNTHRHTRDSDRQVITKGSVFAVILEKEISESVLLAPLQERCAEGFGNILIDPRFLMKVRGDYFSGIELEKLEKLPLKTDNDYLNNDTKDESLIALVKKRKERHSQIQNIDLAVNEFIDQNKGSFRKVTASQWGTVRSFAKLFPDLEELKKQLFSDGTDGHRKGFLLSGIAEEKWRNGRHIIQEILESDEGFPKPRNLFIEKLASEMAKLQRKKDN